MLFTGADLLRRGDRPPAFLLAGPLELACRYARSAIDHPGHRDGCHDRRLWLEQSGNGWLSELSGLHFTVLLVVPVAGGRGRFSSCAARGRSTGSYRVPLYPWLPLLFCLSSGYMLYKSVPYAYQMTKWGLLASIVVLALGAGLSFWVESRD